MLVHVRICRPQQVILQLVVLCTSGKGGCGRLAMVPLELLVVIPPADCWPHRLLIVISTSRSCRSYGFFVVNLPGTSCRPYGELVVVDTSCILSFLAERVAVIFSVVGIRTLGARHPPPAFPITAVIAVPSLVVLVLIIMTILRTSVYLSGIVAVSRWVVAVIIDMLWLL